MYPAFDDITSRIAEPPTWFDENGTPRWGTFHPTMLGVQDQVVGLFEIACQSCGDTFLIGVGWSHFDVQEYNVRLADGEVQWMTIRQFVTAGGAEVIDTRQVDTAEILNGFGFGDAPSAGPHRGCAGATMSSDGPVLRQAWRKNDNREWERDPQAEKVWWDANGLDADTLLVLAKSSTPAPDYATKDPA